MYYVVIIDSFSEVTDLIECQSKEHAISMIEELYLSNIMEEDVDEKQSYLHKGYAKIITEDAYYEYRIAKT